MISINNIYNLFRILSMVEERSRFYYAVVIGDCILVIGDWRFKSSILHFTICTLHSPIHKSKLYYHGISNRFKIIIFKSALKQHKVTDIIPGDKRADHAAQVG